MTVVVGFCDGAPTATVAEFEADPPAPVQVMAKVTVLERDPLPKLPEVDFRPAQPFEPPEALQEVALLEFQVRVLEPPNGTEEGLAMIETAGACWGGGLLTTFGSRYTCQSK